MSIRDKAKKLDFSGLPQVGGAQQATPTLSPLIDPPVRPKTAPGAMMAYANDQRSDLLIENERLRQHASETVELKTKLQEVSHELSQWEGAKAGRSLDPTKIKRSRWANRHEDSFSSRDFELLKQEIANAGGNVQPIKVRRVNEAPFEYEIIFGHRRHQSCLELGLPVLALVDNVSDTDLFVEMDRENRARKDLSPWEQGVMYRRALDEGLFSSNRKLSEAVGADLSAVGKALALADLPPAVVEAFPSPLDLQFRWAKPLTDAVIADEEGVLARLAQLKASKAKHGAKEILDCIVNRGGGTVPPPEPITLGVIGARATVSMNAKGMAIVEFDAGVVSTDHLRELANLIYFFLEKKTRR